MPTIEMKLRGSILPLSALLSCLACLTGCLRLQPSGADPTRHFLLAPLSATNAQPATATGRSQRVLGLALIDLPDYLSPSAFAVRHSETEIHYNDYMQWAERLDKCMTRVMSANLALLLPGDRVNQGPWALKGATFEIEVRAGRFEVDEKGLATLEASWRILRPTQSQPVYEGRTQLSKAGPAPGADTAGAVATLSALLGEFSQEVAQSLRGPVGQ